MFVDLKMKYFSKKDNLWQSIPAIQNDEKTLNLLLTCAGIFVDTINWILKLHLVHTTFSDWSILKIHQSSTYIYRYTVYRSFDTYFIHILSHLIVNESLHILTIKSTSHMQLLILKILVLINLLLILNDKEHFRRLDHYFFRISDLDMIWMIFCFFLRDYQIWWRCFQQRRIILLHLLCQNPYSVLIPCSSLYRAKLGQAEGLSVKQGSKGNTYV
jgi:hypothetical protein